jgi:cellulose synthase/poly-beta-1,6-N-acetylglucosamine synthase-like glycosyltransferase
MTDTFPVVTTMHVVVCTNREPADVAACLESLAFQAGGLGAMLVCRGLSEAATEEHARAARRALPGIVVLREPRPGLSHARNRALAACEERDVLAFVDDDALIGPGWLARLSAAWDAAEERVACIGGPVRPRFVTDRPRWLDDAMLPVLSMVDYGPSQQDLDPFVRTVYGANVSFRCGPLRRVGGFDPAFGHRGGRVWFSEEDEAQRALARAGWTIRYIPDAWVWHVVAPERLSKGELLRRRFQYGATLGVRRARSPALAARQGASSAVGAPVAVARGDERLFMERALRAAENAGVLAGPLLARRA